MRARGVVGVVFVALVAVSCSRSSGGSAPKADVNTSKACSSAKLAATDTGVSAETITVEVMADTGSSLAPGIFQGDVDAVVGFAKWINSNGGIGCRKLAVRTWDSKFDPREVKNGQLDACGNALALVGGNSVFNPDTSAMEQCKDNAGQSTGLPDVAAFSVDTHEMCSPMTIGVNTKAEGCPVAPNTDRPFVRVAGPMKKLLELHPGLHGVYLGNSDLPSTKVSAIPDIGTQEKVGIRFDAKLLNSAREQQTAYVPRAAFLKSGSNYVYGGTSDTALTFFMKEAIAQGVDMSKVTWACNVACYTRTFLTNGASAVEGAYVWVPFVPLEETDTNKALEAYVTTIGRDKVDTWGVVSWEAGLAFKQAVDKVVADKGPNGITRATLLEALRGMRNFDAAGISGPRTLGDPSPCYVLVQVRGGKFVRVWPAKSGTLDCDPGNLVTVTANAEKQAASDLR